MSSYTYSHRIKGNKIDSSRFRLGTTSQGEILEPFSFRVFESRGIKGLDILIKDYNLTYVGIGWDISVNQFKVYLMYEDILKLPEDLKILTSSVLSSEGRLNALLPYGLISFTYDISVNPAILYEKKVYVYPKSIETAVYYFDIDFPDSNAMPLGEIIFIYLLF